MLRPKKHNLEAARTDVNADRVMSDTRKEFPAGTHDANLNLAYFSQSPVNYYKDKL